MTDVDLSQGTGSDRDVRMRPCQERAHTKEKRERGVRKCAVHSCREAFSGATPMLYYIRRNHAGGAQIPEEFVSVQADLSAEALAERRLGRVDWTFSRPVQEVVSRVSLFGT